MADSSSERAPERLVSTGIEGLDAVMNGGFIAGRLFLVEGVPGSGKTTLAFQFLLEGRRRGETVLHISLCETKDEILAMCASHGWSSDGVSICEVLPSAESLKVDQQYTVFHPSEVELSRAIQSILEEVERAKPSRVVIDSLSELRLLAGNPLRYRRQILALKQYFSERDATVLLLDDRRETAPRDEHVETIAHAVVLLDSLSVGYGADRRRLRVTKSRGQRVQGGFHDFVIRRGGLAVFPRLIAAQSRGEIETRVLQTGVEGLDKLLKGGIESGTNTLIAGPAGVGKSTIAGKFAATAALRGQRAAVFLFDEAPRTFLRRMSGIGVEMAALSESGVVQIQQIDPAELTPGEFVDAVRKAADAGAEVVVIDSLNGFLEAMPDERFLSAHLHELMMYLGHKGVATILIAVHSGLVGSSLSSNLDTSYLTDSIILLRYFETGGTIRQAVSVVKKRGGAHERTIRELTLHSSGIHVGDTLEEFSGVLGGSATYHGGGGDLSFGAVSEKSSP